MQTTASYGPSRCCGWSTFPTWGAYFQVKDRGILSIREVRALPIKTAVKAEVSNQSLLWNQIVRVAKIDPMAERYAPLRRDVRIEIGKAD